MAESKRPIGADEHLALAKSLFNSVWTLLDTEHRTRELDDQMIHAAHASRYHWSHVGKPLNLARGEWQISRVYAVLGRTEPALHHARRCLELCEEHQLGSFDVAFAHEALARAGAGVERDKHIELAHQSAAGIQDIEDRKLLLDDLATL